MEMPEGCSASMQVSYIEDEKLRPKPESCWLYEVSNSYGGGVVGVTTTFNTAVEKAISAMR